MSTYLSLKSLKTDMSLIRRNATRAMVHLRTSALAVAAGRAPSCVKQSDYEQAKRELTGESDLNRQNAILDGRRLKFGARRP